MACALFFFSAHLSPGLILGPRVAQLTAMVCSAIFFMDLKGKILISRNYRGDVSRTQADKCVRRACE